MSQPPSQPFRLLEATLSDVERAFNSGLTALELVQLYLNRIVSYDAPKDGINSILRLNPHSLEEAERADRLRSRGETLGQLHGIPIILKDQIDAAGMPTTLGSVLFQDYFPTKDSTVVARLKKAGAIILAKASLGELGAGDTHGSLFGSTRNPYDFERTVGGSSGGPAAAIASNFAMLAVGQEGYASIHRPSAWNNIVGMRPTPGLVSRAGVYGGWPTRRGSLGPMARTVADLARLLDAMVAYDSEDPLTAHGVGHFPTTYTKSLDRDGLNGARIGVLRTPMGARSEPDSRDFIEVAAVFHSALDELARAGADIVDHIEVPDLNELMAARATEDEDAAFKVWASRSKRFPYRSRAELTAQPEYARIRAMRRPSGDTSRQVRLAQNGDLAARELLMTNVLKVMADSRLDAIVHKTVEHEPTLIREGVAPPYHNGRGATHLNTFLVYAASMTVPAGFTPNNLPVGITFLGRPYSEPTLLRLAYAYEQSTGHRSPPLATPPLPDEP